MNKLLIIHGLIIFLGVYISDPFCQDCSCKEKSKNSLNQTVSNRVDKIKNVIESLMLISSFEEQVQFNFWSITVINFEIEFLESSYLLSLKPIRAPPLA